jgi:OmpA-OmpF porin, OOP family
MVFLSQFLILEKWQEWKMRKLALTMVSTALLSAPFGLQAEEKGWYIGSSLNQYFLDDERFLNAEDEESTTVGMNLGYRLDSPLAFEVGYQQNAGDTDIDVIDLSSYYYFARGDGGWSPYLTASFSHFKFDEPAALANDDDDTEQLGFGFGLSKQWNNQFEVKGGAKLLVFGGEDDATDFALNLGLNYYFEKQVEPAPVVAEPEPTPAPPQTRTITVQLKVLFEFDKADVRAIYGDELMAIANAMKEHSDIQLQLEGHTDAIGTDAYNQDLSLRRVQAVKAKLTEVYGIPGNRISTVGFGESRPIADNSTDAGRAQNRRVIGQVSFEEVIND